MAEHQTVVHLVCPECHVDLCCSGAHPCVELERSRMYVLA